jgi:hypothetical protein
VGAWLLQVLKLSRPDLFGQLMDLDEDQQACRYATAVLLGARPAKLLLALMLLAEGAIAWRWLRGKAIALFMAGGAAFFILDALFGSRRCPLGFTKAFFVGWNLIVIGTMYIVWRYGLFVVEG